MTRIARKSDDLAKRIKRFLLRERKRDRVLSDLLDRLMRCQAVYLFGGVLRDIALYGISRLDESDIDLVCVGPSGSLYSAVAEGDFEFKRNKFGGFRVETDWWFVDLWNAEETWAFRRGGRQYGGVESLLDTTITNWESILFKLEGCTLLHGEDYFKDLNEGYLDVIFDRNPNPLGMYVRILRAYACKEASIFSSRAAKVLSAALDVHSFEDVSAYERNHYRVNHIAKSVYDRLKARVKSPDLFPVELGRRRANFSLWDVCDRGTANTVEGAGGRPGSNVALGVSRPLPVELTSAKSLRRHTAGPESSRGRTRDGHG